jgi:hypothetical protein
MYVWRTRSATESMLKQIERNGIRDIARTYVYITKGDLKLKELRIRVGVS